MVLLQSEQQTLLQEQLNKVNQSLVFLVFVILSILLSFYGTIIQRQELVCFLLGKERPEWLPEVFPFRISASALVIGALGFFLCLALPFCHNQLGRGSSGFSGRAVSVGRSAFYRSGPTARDRFRCASSVNLYTSLYWLCLFGAS